MRTKLCVVVAGLGLLAALAAKPVVAHHAFNAEFDPKRPVKFKGIVTKMVWVNPHAWIYVDVKKPDGTVETWMVEGGTPNTLQRRGLTRDTIPVGTVIVVEGFQSKDGTLRANGRNLTLPDGRIMFMGSTGTGAPEDGRDPTEKK